MPYTIGMNNAAQTTGHSLYAVNVLSVGYSVECTVTRYPASGKPRTVAFIRERNGAEAVRAARRAVRNARHCGGL